MATARQIAANRRNAQRSTGPRTPEGKSASKYNAFKHGLAASTILPHEDPAEYHRMRAALIETWQPASAQELLEVDNITVGWWCMQRSNRFEKRMFELQLLHMKRIHRAVTADPHPDDDGGIAASFCNRDNDKSYELLFRYDARAASRYYRALDHLIKLQSFRKRLQRRDPEALTSQLASFGEPPQPPPLQHPASACENGHGFETAAEAPAPALYASGEGSLPADAGASDLSGESQTVRDPHRSLRESGVQADLLSRHNAPEPVHGENHTSHVHGSDRIFPRPRN